MEPLESSPMLVAGASNVEDNSGSGTGGFLESSMFNKLCAARTAWLLSLSALSLCQDDPALGTGREEASSGDTETRFLRLWVFLLEKKVFIKQPQCTGLEYDESLLKELANSTT